MAITTSLNADIRTVTLTYTGATTKITPLLTDAATWLYVVMGMFHIKITEGEPPDTYERDLTWGELTNAQKLKIIDQGVRWTLLKWSKEYYFNANISAAQQAVVTTGDATYELIE